MKKLPALLTTLVAANSIFAADLSWNGKFNDSKEYNSNIVRIDKPGVWSPDQTPTAADNIDISYDSQILYFGVMGISEESGTS